MLSQIFFLGKSFYLQVSKFVLHFIYKVNICVLSPQHARSASLFKQGCKGGSNETT